MSKKAFTLFILVLIGLFAGAIWYLFFRSDTETPTTGIPTSTNLFPFGKNGSSTQTVKPDEPGTVVDLGAETPETPRLRHVSLVPTAGVVIFATASSTNIRYTERATGHIYETQTDTPLVRKISNVTIPKIYEALWTTDGSRFLARYTRDDSDVIRTFYAKIATTTKSEQALEGLFLEDGIKNVSINDDSMFYFHDTQSGSQGIISRVNGADKTEVFTTPFSNWTPVWGSKNMVTIYSKPSGIVEGVAYLLDPKTGSYTKVVSDVLGLTALGNTDGTLVFYSSGLKNNITSSLFSVKKGTSQSLGISTLSEKCVWGIKEKTVIYCAVPKYVPQGLYPDDWYKGKISLNDSLWKIDTVSGSTEQIMDPEIDAGASFDMIKLSIDANETTLLFTDKNDMTVWSYRVQ